MSLLRTYLLLGIGCSLLSVIYVLLTSREPLSKFGPEAQLRSEPASERVRRIWGGIIQFANGEGALEDFTELLARCSHKETEADWKRSDAGKRALERELQEKLSPKELATMKDLTHS